MLNRLLVTKRLRKIALYRLNNIFRFKKTDMYYKLRRKKYSEEKIDIFRIAAIKVLESNKNLKTQNKLQQDIVRNLQWIVCDPRFDK